MLVQPLSGEAGANKRRKITSTDESALVSACCDGSTAVVVALLNILNVDNRALTASKRTLLMLASERGHEEIVEKLMDLKADVNARDLDQSTALILACANGHKDIADHLIAGGADVDASTLAKFTALIAVLVYICLYLPITLVTRGLTLI